MSSPKNSTIKLIDYTKSDFEIESLELEFELDAKKTYVTSKAVYTKFSHQKKLVLNGEQQDLVSVEINGNKLDKSSFKLTSTTLEIFEVPECFTLTIKTIIYPSKNTSLLGLYMSSDILCTQCEAEGFRRITYFLDRPDVMTKYRTKLIAHKNKFPVLLSNGNKVDSGELGDGRHWTIWEDPFKKPSYLFALVAGDLSVVRDVYVTSINKKKIDIEIYCDKGNEGKCDHAMRSLKNSMKWDEEKFGLEYDLDMYMIVAVNSFNMGAMENKGLNIFNSAYVLARKDTATDDDFLGIESVIGHEYFHNWTGNRITCRDWFQLTLKEGLTVYRDQEFSSDMNSRSVQRIKDVLKLRSTQFVEDSGPTAHPIKPKSYIQIDNFYTTTIYEKGAEIIRMIEKIVGKEGFRKGMDKYFELYDGQAVTTDDFVHAMEIANGTDLTHFKRWYDQAGTPIVKINELYDETSKKYTLELEQTCEMKTYGESWRPCHLPVLFCLFDSQGNEIFPETLESLPNLDKTKKIWHLKENKEKATFLNLEHRPILSFNRQFSCPIIVKHDRPVSDHIFLMKNDTDEFNRFESSQILATDAIMQNVDLLKEQKELSLDPFYIESFGSILYDDSLGHSIKASCLDLPSMALLKQEMSNRSLPIDIHKLLMAREGSIKTLGQSHQEFLFKLYNEFKTDTFDLSSKSMGKRELKNICLSFLTSTENPEYIDLAYQQFINSNNMTDELASLSCLAKIKCDKTELALDSFYKKWKDEPLVIQKWFALKATQTHDPSLKFLIDLANNPAFDKKVPNFLRSLYTTFANQNDKLFHQENGHGYKIMIDRILEIDKYNPDVSARMFNAFRIFKKLEINLQNEMKIELERLKNEQNLSKNLFEIVSQITS
ncbi:MAG: aminopeptidase N [Halobacteriovoraceae bacterium]|nr:aminopeptidase N [Halobacteriovoraceae bacterium]